MGVGVVGAAWRYTVEFPRRVWGEAVVFAWLVLAVIDAFALEHYGAIPLLSLFTVGFGMTALGGMKLKGTAVRDARRRRAEAA